MENKHTNMTVQAESVDDFLEKISLLVTKGCWDTIGISQCVKGSVDQVNIWNETYAYVTISSDNQSITGRCSATLAPARGDHIIFSGTLYIKPSKISKGFDVQLIGEPIGSWEPVSKVREKVIPFSKEIFRPLSDWLS